ncbi:DgyrCDS11902 [Dimorphilus gyrociliatus]|uniref:DgyrCDS11902 n=1 Tax=Dimorphilus gyrociliatus TaxID=2664684 RepID=A0A7I8W5R0_9ANNE|nr:DgyrCDS11902 [Dimorphilus gyrociliatus]
MNIEVYGRVRPSVHGERAVHISESFQSSIEQLVNRPGAPYHSINEIFPTSTTNSDIFSLTTRPLVDLWASGFNCCLIVTGESNSGKAFTVVGNNSSSSGIFSQILYHIFSKIGEDEEYYGDERRHPPGRLKMQMYEIFNENVRDLLAVTPKVEFCQFEESAEKGTFVQNGTVGTVPNVLEGCGLFRRGLNKRSAMETDYGSSEQFSNIVIYLDLNVKLRDQNQSHSSRFTICVTQGAERLRDDTVLIKREGENLSKSIITLSQLVASLANQPHADRVIPYNHSKLTTMLKEEIGGNSKTTVLVCLKPKKESSVVDPILRMCAQFSQVKNFPLVNDNLALQLITQYRARLIYLQNIAGFGANAPFSKDIQSELLALQSENIELRDHVEKLQHQHTSLKTHVGTLANSKADVSEQLLLTQKDRLQISQTLVDLKLKNHQLREEYEEVQYHLKNKILNMEEKLNGVLSDKQKEEQKAKYAEERLLELQKVYKDLSDEYTDLRASYAEMRMTAENEKRKVIDLSVELLRLVKEKANLQQQLGQRVDEEEGERWRHLVTDDEAKIPNRRIRQELEDNYFLRENEFREKMDKLKTDFEKSGDSLELRIAQLQTDLKRYRQSDHDKQLRLAKLESELIYVKSEKDEIEKEYNRLQHKVKDKTSEFRSTLTKYINDIAIIADNQRNYEFSSDKINNLRKKVDEMLQELKKSYKTREEQLCEAVVKEKNIKKGLVKKYEQLLVAYRQLQVSILEKHEDFDIGSKEQVFQLDEKDLLSSQQEEIFRLKNQIDDLENTIENSKYNINTDLNKNEKKLEMDKLRREVKEFTINTQRELEDERAQLMTEKAILQEEVSELRNYIDKMIKNK